MKKLILPLVAVGFIFAGTSCKKDFTCSCTDNGGYEYQITESKKAAAAAICTGEGIGDIKIDGTSVKGTNSCELK